MFYMVRAVKTFKAGRTADLTGDFVFDAVGPYGIWQCYILLIMCVGKVPVGMHQLATVFLAPPVIVTCADPGNDTDVCSSDCKKYDYDKSIFTNTIIMEWDLICDKAIYADIGQAIFFFGILTGNVLFGIWSDKKGRKPPLMFSSILQLSSGIGAAFSKNYWLFVFLRFLCAVATGGNMLTSFVVLMEIIGPKYRELTNGVIFHLPFNLGHLSLSLVAYYIRDFREFQLAISLYSIITFLYFVSPESPRWLMNANRVEESIDILEKAARLNKRSEEGIRAAVLKARASADASPPTKKGRVSDLLRTPNLRKWTLCLFFNWFSVGFNYFGISQYVSKLGGNIFLNVAVSATFGIPGVLLAGPACKYFGRVRAIAFANTCTLVSMFIFLFVPKSMEDFRVFLASVAVFGAMWFFASIYVIAAEVFPTVARNAGIGACSMLARIGAMVSGFSTTINKSHVWALPVLFCITSSVSILLILMVPETKNRPLPETLEEAENVGKKNG